MSLLSVLKTIGKDLSHVGTWIDDGLKSVAPIVAIVDPPLAPIMAEVESFIEGLQAIASQNGVASPSFTPAQIQAIVTSVSTLHALKSSVMGVAKPTS